MEQDIEDRLARIEKVVSDNNAMLTKLRNAQKNAVYWRLVYWLVIIGLTLASFYFIEPYIGQLGAAYGIGGDSSSTTTPSTTESLLNFVKQYQEDQKKTQ